MAKQKWSIQQLKQAMNKDLSKCNSAFERSNIEGVCWTEIRNRAIEIKATRNFKSNEAGILSSLGIYL